MEVIARNKVELVIRVHLTVLRPHYGELGADIPIAPFNNAEDARQWEEDFKKAMEEVERDERVEFKIDPGEIRRIIGPSDLTRWEIVPGIYSPTHLAVELKYYVQKYANEAYYEVF